MLKGNLIFFSSNQSELFLIGEKKKYEIKFKIFILCLKNGEYMLTLEEFVNSRDRFLVAHRGASGVAPENTMAAFRIALEQGAHMIEIDLQLTSDDIPVIFHDSALDRTSNGKGIVGHSRYEEISGLDAGSWFSEEFEGEKIPALDEFSKFIKDKAYLNIEIKSRKTSPIENRLDKILDIIKDHNLGQYTLFSSFDHGLLMKIKEKEPAFHTAAIMIPNDKRLPSEICGEIGAEGFVCSLLEINENIAKNAAKNDIYVGVYSIDKPDHMEIIRPFKIKAVVTNYPGRINI